MLAQFTNRAIVIVMQNNTGRTHFFVRTSCTMKFCSTMHFIVHNLTSLIWALFYELKFFVLDWNRNVLNWTKWKKVQKNGVLVFNSSFNVEMRVNMLHINYCFGNPNKLIILNILLCMLTTVKYKIDKILLQFHKCLPSSKALLVRPIYMHNWMFQWKLKCGF